MEEWFYGNFASRKHKQFIVTILESRVFIYFPFHFPLILLLKVWHVDDRGHAEMVSISPNITAIIARHVASVDWKIVNWTWFCFKKQEVYIV